jgi:hypothetical protein
MQGGSFALVATRGQNRGKISVSVDGGATELVDLYATSTQLAQVVWSSSGLSAILALR